MRELNEKLLKFAGITRAVSHQSEDPQRLIWDGWNFPDGTLGHAPDFPNDLNACFKWLVPKIIGGADYSITITQDLARCVGYVRPMQGGRQYDAMDNQNPALALCLAIEKLIDKEATQ